MTTFDLMDISPFEEIFDTMDIIRDNLNSGVENKELIEKINKETLNNIYSTLETGINVLVINKWEEHFEELCENFEISVAEKIKISQEDETVTFI